MVYAFVIVTYKYIGSHCPLHCRTGLSWPGCLLQHLPANQPPACLRAIYIATDSLHKTTRGVCLMQRRRLGHIARTLCGRGVVRFVPASEATRTKWRGRSPCAALRLLLHQCTIRSHVYGCTTMFIATVPTRMWCWCKVVRIGPDAG
jgi:hypothetical protein